jgi:translation initiation factor 1 (eIF-1/SUI1)
MAKLTSLSDLSTLLSSDYKVAEKVQKQLGYDGKPVQIKVHIDKKGRGGKTVTIISGFQSKPDEL